MIVRKSCLPTWIIRAAESEIDLERCLPVMAELRTDLEVKYGVKAFISQVRKQEAESFRIIFLEDENQVRAVAGYRIMHKLYNRKSLYIDDLVTRAKDRSKGYGESLIDWLVNEATRQGCAAVELDSGVQRFDAHRFYLRKRMIISSHHFLLKLNCD
jgi:GNAT superfamily N-acetyltransferase